jgi:hypothetical protein
MVSLLPGYFHSLGQTLANKDTKLYGPRSILVNLCYCVVVILNSRKLRLKTESDSLTKTVHNMYKQKQQL